MGSEIHNAIKRLSGKSKEDKQALLTVLSASPAEEEVQTWINNLQQEVEEKPAKVLMVDDRSGNGTKVRSGGNEKADPPVPGGSRHSKHEDIYKGPAPR